LTLRTSWLLQEEASDRHASNMPTLSDPGSRRLQEARQNWEKKDVGYCHSTV